MAKIRFKELLEEIKLPVDDVVYLVDSSSIEVIRKDNDLYFPDRAVAAIRQVEKFIEIGYSLEDAARIVRNVGVPGESRDGEKKKPRTLYTPGELAKLFDISSRAVKYWEEKRLIKPYTRSKTGIRFYHKKTITEIILLRDFQHLGFSLDEIKIFLDLYNFVLMGKNSAKDQKKAKEFLTNLDQLDLTLDKYEDAIRTLRRLSRKGRQKLKLILQFHLNGSED